jgi:RNA polymerase sigma factor (sigma-70 family)
MMTHEQDHRDDELLAIRCQLGERAAFEELITRWHGPIWTYIRRVVGDDDAASDAMQDVWVRVIRAMPALRDGTRLRGWLFSIARRTLMDRFRQQYARPADVGIDGHDIPDEAWTGSGEEDLQDLEHALAGLPIVEREVITLFYLDELSLGEVAEMLKVPVGTVKSRLFRARRLLRQEMNTRGPRT